MDYDKAADYWKQKDGDAVKAEPKLIADEAEKFIAAHNTCALATGFTTQVRCTPIEYTYWKGCFWLLSEGGEKFRNLKENKNVSLAIYDAYTGFGELGGMQVSGVVQLIEPWSEDYRELLCFKKIPESALLKLDHPMYLLRITPLHIDFLSSGFKKLGVSSRQQLDY